MLVGLRRSLASIGPDRAMALAVGFRLGPNQVTATIGEGGMGEVLRARGAKLDRHVTPKVLPQAFKDSPDRLARFGPEAG